MPGRTFSFSEFAVLVNFPLGSQVLVVLWLGSALSIVGFILCAFKHNALIDLMTDVVRQHNECQCTGRKDCYFIKFNACLIYCKCHFIGQLLFILLK